MGSIDPANKAANMARAFRVAEEVRACACVASVHGEHMRACAASVRGCGGGTRDGGPRATVLRAQFFGVEPLFDVEDLVDVKRPDEKIVLTYVSLLFKGCAEFLHNQVLCKAIKKVWPRCPRGGAAPHGEWHEPVAASAAAAARRRWTSRGATMSGSRATTRCRRSCWSGCARRRRATAPASTATRAPQSRRRSTRSMRTSQRRSLVRAGGVSCGVCVCVCVCVCAPFFGCCFRCHVWLHAPLDGRSRAARRRQVEAHPAARAAQHAAELAAPEPAPGVLPEARACERDGGRGAHAWFARQCAARGSSL